MARVNKVTGRVVKKKAPRAARRTTGIAAMPVTKGWWACSSYVQYEVESREWGGPVKEYIRQNYSKEQLQAVNKLPDYRTGMHAAWSAACWLINNNHQDIVHPDYIKGIPVRIESLVNDAMELVAKKKEKDTSDTKKNIYVPSIKERMLETCSNMVTEIEEFVEGFVVSNDTTTVKDFNPLSILRKLMAKPGHVRIIRGWYVPERDEMFELLNPPSPAQKKRLSEYDLDQLAQLKEGYAHLSTKVTKSYLDIYQKIINACDIIEKEAKSTRKPRKVKVKSPEDLTKNMKFKISDETYGIASLSPASLVGANIALVFNCKTRKLGLYYASNIDPKGMGRPGSGFGVKGTTLTGFDQERSVQRTLRKPAELLPQIKKTTRSKTEKLFQTIKTTEIKMNGRFNADTIIMAVF